MNTQMKLIILFSFSFLFNVAFGQESGNKYIKKGDFPDGVYMTLEDVLSKTPSSTDEIYFKTSYSYDSINLPEKAFFYFKKKDKRLIYPLAVSYKGEMYFQTYNKYTNKKDKGYDPDQTSRFCKVTNYGRFIYFEEDMRGIWSKALSINLNPMWYKVKGKTKGIVLDLDNKELNMLRDCDDINNFLTSHQILDIKCNSEDLTLGELRTMIDEINKPYR